MNAPVVIIGTGLAGYNVAREFRKLDSETPLLLITADDGRSYSKPMLSTGFGKNKEADGLSMAEPGTMAEQLNAEVRTHTRVSGIDPGHKRLWIGEEAVAYRDLILAWGAETVRVPVQGDAGESIFPINDLEDYARFRAAAAGKRRVLLLGAGLIGCEFANDLSLGGYEVQLVAPCEQVMPTLLHPAAAAAVQAGLESLGDWAVPADSAYRCALCSENGQALITASTHPYTYGSYTGTAGDRWYYSLSLRKM